MRVELIVLILVIIVTVLNVYGQVCTERYCTKYNDEPGTWGRCCDWVDWQDEPNGVVRSNRQQSNYGVMEREDVIDDDGKMRTRCRINDYFKTTEATQDNHSQSRLHYGAYPGNIINGGYN